MSTRSTGAIASREEAKQHARRDPAGPRVGGDVCLEVVPQDAEAVADRAVEGAGDRRVRPRAVDARRRVAVRAGRAGEAVEVDRVAICEELRDRFDAFKRRSLYDIRLVALFLDATFIPVRPSGPNEGVLVAWGFTEDGERVLLR
jgi:hypothetical protein